MHPTPSQQLRPIQRVTISRGCRCGDTHYPACPLIQGQPTAAWLLLALLLLIGCGSTAALPLAAAQQTALVAGCWPGNGQTPLPVTSTPLGGFVATPDPLLPTPSALPSSTAYPRCTPEPGAPTLVPYPTRAPTRVPFPTRAAFRSREAESVMTVMHVAETILRVDLATHPTENWPTVIAVAAPLVTDGDPLALVRVFDPTVQRWRDATSLGTGGSSLARTRFRTAQLGIAGDGSILAVWGATREPHLGLQASISRDHGQTWSAPEPIARDTYGVLDLAVAPDGQVAVLAISEAAQRPILIRRDAGGTWHAPETIAIPAWYGSWGAIALLGTANDLQIAAVTTGGGLGSADNTLFLMTRSFAGGAWEVERRSVASPDDKPAGLLTSLRAAPLSGDRVLFPFAMAGRAHVFALSYATVWGWGQVERVVSAEGKTPPFVAALGDGATGSAAVIWTCCGDATFVSAESTHYAAFSQPGTSVWQAAPFPFVSGAVAAADTAAAQAPGSGSAWLAWVENVHTVQVRAIDLSRLIDPASGLPAPTEVPQ